MELDFLTEIYQQDRLTFSNDTVHNNLTENDQDKSGTPPPPNKYSSLQMHSLIR